MLALLFLAVLCCWAADAYTLRQSQVVARLRGETRLQEMRLYAKKKSSKPRGPQTALPPVPKAAPVPRRVMADSNVSVRKQIGWAKAYKRFQTNTSSNLGECV
jgi:hypothetical protein